ncbi:hypothetical protein CRUP_029050, partial [Coryphaenoides rupestris]
MFCFLSEHNEMQTGRLQRRRRGFRTRVASVPGSTGRCLLTLLGVAFILSGLIVGGACLYRYFAPKFSDVSAGVGGENQPYYLPRVEEEVEISDNLAVISKLTAYLDLTLRTCFVIPLNTSVVLPPQDLVDLFMQLRSGSYRSYLVQEDLVVTERVDDVKPLGFYIRRLCDGKETYRMQPRSQLPGGKIRKRSEEKCFTIRHFENKTCFVIPLNTSVVLPPQDLVDLFMQLRSGSYRSYLVQEDLVVTERVDDVKPLGFYIRRLCDGKETYRMQPRS